MVTLSSVIDSNTFDNSVLNSSGRKSTDSRCLSQADVLNLPILRFSLWFSQRFSLCLTLEAIPTTLPIGDLLVRNPWRKTLNTINRTRATPIIIVELNSPKVETSPYERYFFRTAGTIKL